MEFPRQLYYSQTEACKIYKISTQKFKKLIAEQETVNKTITLHSLTGEPYQLTTIYILKIVFIKIMLDLI